MTTQKTTQQTTRTMTKQPGRGGAVALVAAGVASVCLATAGMAVAESTAASHTLRFSSVQTAEKRFAGNHFVDADKDVAKGKVLGFDVVDGVFHPKSGTFTVDFAGSLGGGTVYLHGTGDGRTGKFKGSVVGGTGQFKGARGSVTGRSIGSREQNEKLVIVYRR